MIMVGALHASVSCSADLQKEHSLSATFDSSKALSTADDGACLQWLPRPLVEDADEPH